jgi:two-component system, chemotaxis family, sensor histidine kinase and response regulator WspE
VTEQNNERNSSILELFYSELRLQVKEYTKELETYISIRHSDSALNLSRIVHSIKGAAKLVNQQSIAKLSDSLEGYYNVLADGGVTFDTHQENALKKTETLFGQLANSSFEQFKETIEAFSNSLENAAEQISLFTTKPPEQQAVNTSGKTQNESPSGNHPNVSNQKELLIELGQHAEILDKGMNQIKTDFNNEHVLDDMRVASRKIETIGEKISLKIVALVGSALHSCFDAAFKKKLIWTRGHLDLLVESVDFLKRLSQCDSQSLKTWLGKYEKNADAIASVLLAISREASSIPSKNEEQVIPHSPQTKNVKNSPNNSSKESSDHLLIDEKMLDLFYEELDQRVREMNEGLLALEKQPDDHKILEGLMRAAHSVKGAAKIVEFSQISRLAHALEDFFTYIPQKKLVVTDIHIDRILNGVDLLERLTQVPYSNVSRWLKTSSEEIDEFIEMVSDLPDELTNEKKQTDEESPGNEKNVQIEKEPPQSPPIDIPKRHHKPSKLPQKKECDNTATSTNPFLRVSASILNKLMGLAGESLVEARWLVPYVESLVSLKRSQGKLGHDINKLNEYLRLNFRDERAHSLVQSLKQNLSECNIRLNERIGDLELYTQRQTSLSDRLYSEVISSRMRPFADGVEFFPRLVRDISKQLNKKVTLVVDGKNTPVDREILAKLESPLNHLIRNAIDHGIESPEERTKKGKTETGTIKMEVSHRAGMLSIIVSDDGRGIDIKNLTQKVIEKGFVTQSMAGKLNNSELLEFMFLPGFSTSDEVTELSGRGIGLNVVQNMVQEVGGTIKALIDDGLSFHLQLPLTMSVIRALLVEISDEPYAIPLGRLKRVIYLSKDDIHVVEHRQYFHEDDKNIGLIPAQQFLGLSVPDHYHNELCVIVISDGLNDYGVIVDRFLGEKELVVHELDPGLGKVPDISGGAFMEDGSPILIIDVEDMVRSIDKQLTRGELESIEFDDDEKCTHHNKKRILVVDDSITVREVECRLLKNNGYAVDTAINGVDGWNAVRVGNYDLVITDVDMPRMNGIEFVRSIRGDSKLQDLPVMIVSYKERESDRKLGLDAGANYYLTKSSFHDESLLSAVHDLIGENE